MTCLEELIGIKKGCADVEPVTGLYINDLPAMSLKLADAAANKEKVNGFTLIQDRIRFASDYLTNDIRNYLQDKFIINSLLEQTTVGHYDDDNDTTTTSSRLRGLRIVVREYPYLNINISRIGLRFADAITTNILIYDLYKNELLETIPITTVADQIVYLEVNKQIQTNGQRRALFICVDASLSDQYNASTYMQGAEYGCKSCNKNSYLSYVSSGYISDGLSKTDGNFTSSSTTGGLTVDYTVECDMSNYICSLGRSLAWPLLYKTGHLIMQELKHSEQLNTVVLINKAQNDELLSYYEAEYIKSLNQLTSNLKVPKDICFQCSPTIKKVIQLP
jgi:hypothetical protein